jgi:AP-2 complex subunit alpha
VAEFSQGILANTHCCVLDSSSRMSNRGLHNFISDIRNATSKEEERIRVGQELANIRFKFTTSANLNSSQKTKYIRKLCYISMLGYEVDLGHLEIISLLSSTKFQEKSVGYMAVSILPIFKPNDSLTILAVNSMKNDLVGNLYFGTTLALCALANIGVGSNFAGVFCAEVQNLILHPNNQFANLDRALSPEEEKAIECSIRKKAILCLLHLYRTNPAAINVSAWVDQFPILLANRDLGVLTSAISLLLSFTAGNPVQCQRAIPCVVDILKRLIERVKFLETTFITASRVLGFW